MFGFQSSEFFWKNRNFSNSQKRRENSSELISCFWVKKPCFWVKKFGNPCFGEFMENSEFVLFRKLQKNDVKIETQKSRKTRSDSKPDLNVPFKVQNAGP